MRTLLTVRLSLSECLMNSMTTKILPPSSHQPRICTMFGCG